MGLAGPIDFANGPFGARSMRSMQQSPCLPSMFPYTVYNPTYGQNHSEALT